MKAEQTHVVEDDLAMDQTIDATYSPENNQLYLVSLDMDELTFNRMKNAGFRLAKGNLLSSPNGHESALI